jgi:hypothetical protein
MEVRELKLVSMFSRDFRRVKSRIEIFSAPAMIVSFKTIYYLHKCTNVFIMRCTITEIDARLLILGR